MQAVGIICEYNPFHNGHAYQISRTREIVGECAVVCVMSATFVQRGEWAIAPKHIRAQMAVEGGADLVLELPSPYSLLSAEGFAAAAVHILSSLNVLTHLSFGAENENIDELTHVARILLDHQTIVQTLAGLTEGLSYASARERALFAQIKEKSSIISTPNNILAVEYLKALITQRSAIIPLAIQRRGAAHDSEIAEHGFASASLIRQMLCEKKDVSPFMPPAAFKLLPTAFPGVSRMDAALMPALLRQTPESLRGFPAVSEGLEHRLLAAIKGGGTLDMIARRAQTRRYPLSRIRRLLTRAALGLTDDLSRAAPPYARVLALNERGQRVLRQCAKKSGIPVITKPAHVKNLGVHAQEVFRAESYCSDIFALSIESAENFAPNSDYTAQIRRIIT